MVQGRPVRSKLPAAVASEYSASLPVALPTSRVHPQGSEAKVSRVLPRGEDGHDNETGTSPQKVGILAETRGAEGSQVGSLERIPIFAEWERLMRGANIPEEISLATHG